MAVELTPRGTRGTTFPTFARPLMKIMFGVMVGLYRLLGGRGLRMMGQPLVLLNTVGAKTGQPRHALVCRFPDGDHSWLVVASFAGSAKHPDWYVNMAKNPDKVWVEIGKRELKVRPETLKGAEREAAWQRVLSLAPGYAAYQEKTDRQIPVVRLTAEPSALGDRSPAG